MAGAPGLVSCSSARAAGVREGRWQVSCSPSSGPRPGGTRSAPTAPTRRRRAAGAGRWCWRPDESARAMTDLTNLTSDDFAPHAGSRFRLHAEGAAEPLELVLVEVTSGRRGVRRDDRAFSLAFRGPRGLYLPQRIYRLEHEALGTLEIFLVSIAPDPQGSCFEAVFT